MMETWKVLSEDEARENKAALEAEYELRGRTTHPVTFRPYAMYRHKWETGEIVLVPMEREVADAQ